MKNQHVFLLLLFATSCTPHLCAMRRTASLTQHLLGLRQQHLSAQFLHDKSIVRALSATLLTTRSISTGPRIPHPNWLFNECYQALRKDPQNLENIKRIEEQDDYTKQTLLRAATNDHGSSARVLAALLEAGADINKADIEGQTPLHLLAQNSNHYFDETKLMAIFMFIAHYQPDFEKKDMHGKKPRDYAPDKFKDLFTAHEPINHPTIRYMFPGQ